MFGFLRHLGPLSLLPVMAWLVLQLTMSSASAVVVTPSSDNLSLAGSDVIEIIICTPNGLKKVTMTSDGKIQEEVSIECPWCHMFQGLDSELSAYSKATDAEFSSHEIVFNSFIELTYGSIRCQNFLSRGPPTLI